ncbi:sulfotransferase [Flavobacteriaceae bacterium XHP0103]|uniref:sulfotransferase domain-containing protein n=1 Tax=Marixanthotalea marina TaxID=2844359 RepID=UPI002989F73D|nr:sulfotransferase domain-containing protein [Marixanthotalea marina]MBU3822748.1 sulfotransferase [Marixanthotalea marina]
MIEKVIYIGGVARSGTSWIGQIFNSCPNVRFRFQPFFSYEFRGTINEDSSSKDYINFYNDLYRKESSFLTQNDKIKSGVYPSFNKEDENILVFKENRFQSFIEPMLRKSSNLYFVGIIRNPNATLYSWSQNEKEFPPGSDILKEWRFANCKNKSNEDYFGFYKWKEVANLYLDLKEKYKDRVTIIYYDEFIENPIEESRKIFEKLDLPFTNQTNDFLLKAIKGNDDNYYSVFKGKTNKNKWQTNFPKYIISQIEAELKGTRLEKFLS